VARSHPADRLGHRPLAAPGAEAEALAARVIRRGT
jgi:hypothetical protein